jgi:adsorption protein B
MSLDLAITIFQTVALIVAALIAISSLDDLMVDAWYWGREIYRAVRVRPRIRPLPQSALLEREEQRLAIVIPAWQERDVIASMIEDTIAVTNYRDYLIFVGTYPNDPDTIAEVEREARRHRRVVRVQTPLPGPTSKADCLNAVMRAVAQEEASSGRPFAGVVLHDPEDVIHPLELKFFNYLLPRKDLIQIPVVSLERRLRDLVAGAYMDEFAEWHAKDLVVRESLARSVPSAGVGTCFSKRALETLRAQGEVFNTRTLTEDYDIGARLAAAGNLQSIIARYPVEFMVRRRKIFAREGYVERRIRMPLCVREYFPATFSASYRQKARWTIGIALQGWKHLGWTRSPRANYFLMRDRKALVSPILVVLGYVVLLAGLALLFTVGGAALTYPPRWRLLAALLFGFNLVALILRAVQRMYFVQRLYGWEHAVVSLVRMVVASLVSFAATMRALRIFIGHLVTGKPIGWDKTDHIYPTADVLGMRRGRLGEILVRWEAITPDRLEAALTEQATSRRPLGRILLSHEWLDEETLAEAISAQSELPRGQVEIDTVAQNRKLLPDGLCVRLGAAPMGRAADGAPILAVARPLSVEQRREVAAAAAGQAPVERIVRESEITQGLRVMRGVAGPQVRSPLLGDILVEHGLVSQLDFDRALEAYRPETDGRLGEHLVRSGLLTTAALNAALAEQARLAGTGGVQ